MRYVTRSYWSDDLEMEILDPPRLNVFESAGPVSTGLFDSSGNELFRFKDPIGYKPR
ncbi:hypothetical protein LCGC14_0653960 [marine sediment metagenome]|uniref:Uncharacterized protein n=1 Tax=marine sediment metagenome TaxID=412755 RepID=A0A0F9THB6_9ZZZZ